MTPEELEKQNKAALRRLELNKLAPMSYPEVEAVFKKWMILPDTGIIKFVLAFYCTNRLPGKPLWAFLIGPSGGGKTQILDSLLEMTDIYPISTLTPNTFLSGMPGANDASLLPKLSDKIALFKDWTSVLSMQKDARAEVQGQFREIYDGGMTKVFGNGKVRVWKGRVSVLAASTQAIDLNQQATTHLGERFVNYRLVMPDRKEVAMRSLDNDPQQDQMTIDLQNAVYAFFKGINFEQVLKDIPVMPEEMKKDIVNLANFCTMARSGIIRDFGFKKDVIFVPAAEMPTRITSQLSKLVSGLMIVNKTDKMTEDDMKVVYKCALDSIPQTNKMVIQEMAKADFQSTAEIATALGYPTEPIKMYLENLSMLGVCVRTKDGSTYKWKMREEFSEIVRHYEGVEELSEEEIKTRQHDANEFIDEDEAAEEAFNQF